MERFVVLDLTSHLSGPYAAMMLADHGADVIGRKGTGDDARRMPPSVEGESAPSMVWNRNKRSVELDFKADDDKKRLLDLADRADILIENFRPGVLDKLGLRYDASFSIGMDGHDRVAAFAAFQSALALSASSALTYILGSVVLGWGAEAERAIEWSERGLRLSPFDTWAFAALLFTDVVMPGNLRSPELARVRTSRE
ncbi:MAG: CoA transferase [Hyphomicrobiaceae bacterium]